MTNAILYEFLMIVFGLIKSYNVRNVKMLKYLDIVFWGLSTTFLGFSSINRPHKCDKLAWYYEVEISIV